MVSLFKGCRGLSRVVPVLGGRRPVSDLRQTLFGGLHDHVWRPAAGGRWSVVGGRWPAVGGRLSASGGRRSASGNRRLAGGGRRNADGSPVVVPFYLATSHLFEGYRRLFLLSGVLQLIMAITQLRLS